MKYDNVFFCSASGFSEIPTGDKMIVDVSKGTPGIWFEMRFASHPDDAQAQILLSYADTTALRNWLDAAIAKAIKS